MTRMFARRLAVVGACLAWSASAVAHAADPPAGYNRSTETTVSGIIVQVIGGLGPRDVVGVHLSVKTDRGLLNVHVAPAMFIGQNNFWFQTDERVAIIGAMMSSGGDSAMWARAITKNAKTLVLRDENGAPLWKAGDADADGCGVSHPPIR